VEKDGEGEGEGWGRGQWTVRAGRGCVSGGWLWYEWIFCCRRTMVHLGRGRQIDRRPKGRKRGGGRSWLILFVKKGSSLIGALKEGT